MTDGWDAEKDRMLAALGERVALLRAELRLSQSDLALASGVHRITIHKVERGKLDAQISTLGRLADGLGVTVAELLRIDPTSN